MTQQSKCGATREFTVNSDIIIRHTAVLLRIRRTTCAVCWRKDCYVGLSTGYCCTANGSVAWETIIYRAVLRSAVLPYSFCRYWLSFSKNLRSSHNKRLLKTMDNTGNLKKVPLKYAYPAALRCTSRLESINNADACACYQRKTASPPLRPQTCPKA